MALPEPEELVGHLWHRLVGDTRSYPRHPGAAVTLDMLKPRLTIFFRALGGPPGIRVAAVDRAPSRHRLGWRQRLGLGAEFVETAALDDDTLALPAQIDCLPTRTLNENLYFWLTAYCALQPVVPERSQDPLRSDVLRLRSCHRHAERVLGVCPGLRKSYGELAAALLEARPGRNLKDDELAVEQVIGALLGGEPPTGGRARLIHDAVTSTRPLPGLHAGPGYRTFLPVPLWGERSTRQRDVRRGGAREAPPGRSAAAPRRRRASRRSLDQSRRDDPLLLSNADPLHTITEALNVSRVVDDDEPESARQAADAVDELTLSEHPHSPANRLALDLDLAPPAPEVEPLTGTFTYPEWDYANQRLLEAHCRVEVGGAPAAGTPAPADAASRRRIRKVRRQFEALRPRPRRLPAQADGEELDLSALVREVADARAGNATPERVHVHNTRAARDLAVSVLVDVSLSTDAWVEGRRVIDVEKEALTALCYGVTACGDDLEVQAFTSRSRHRVDVTLIKQFEEAMGPAVAQRIEALAPGHYTRIGAALRHAAARLADRPHRHRLLILLSDGKPNDVDHYEGRHGIEDTRHAIREARARGLAVFGVTVDRESRDYFPYLFGRGAYAIVGRVHRLTTALPMIYRQLLA